MALISLSAQHPTQFQVDSDFPLTLPGLTTRDGLVINQDRLADVCEAYEESGQKVSLTAQAYERYQQVNDESEVLTPSFTLPNNFSLYRFQRRCINNLSHQNRGFVQTSTGTGKSLIGTVLGCLRFDAGQIDRLIIWCPSTLVHDWVENIKRFTSLSVGTVAKNASPEKRAQWYATSTDEVWVLNYERVRTADLKAIDAEVRKRRGRIMFLFDEVAKLKGRTSKLHKSMKRLVGPNRVPYVIGMTATPIVTGPEDFYNEFRIIAPNVFGLVKDFERDFTVNNGERDFWGNYLGYQNVDLMHVRAGDMVFSASKRQPEIAKEFPQTHEIAIDIDLSAKERELYQKLFEYGQSLGEGRYGMLFYLTFRRLCNMPEVLLKAVARGGNPDYQRQAADVMDICQHYIKAIEKSKNSVKLARTLEIADEVINSGERLIIFADHTYNCLFPLADHLKEKGFDPGLYVGGMNENERQSALKEFKSGSKPLLLMSDAGQVGLNLQECRTVLHYQTPVTHADYDQRSNRVNRIDSTYDSVTVYRYITQNTIEERIEDTMQGRRKISVNAGFGGEYEEYGSIGGAEADYLCGF